MFTIQSHMAAINSHTSALHSVDFRGMDLMNNSQIQELTRDVLFVLRYDVHRPEGMSDAEFKEYVSTLRTQAQSLESDGWTKKAIKDGYIDTVNASYDPNKEMSIAAQLGEYFNNAHTFGSGIFQKMWGIDYQTAKENNDSKAAEKLLGIAMKYTGMPGELDGSAEQTQAILDKMSDSLAPDDDFWDDFAGTVQVAYPYDSMSSEDGKTALKKKIHQFRYVISAQQAQWVRDNYKKDGMTDEKALAAYLSTLKEGDDSGEYSLDESSRLHNKGKLVDTDGDGEPDSVSYPGGSIANYKVTIGFHSEFIIDSEGNFLNEIDSEGTTENGIVNGASFNYANENDNVHKQLDVDSVKPYDPGYRSKVAKQYISPNNIGGDILSRAKDAWEDYWENGASAHDRIEEARDELRNMIKNQS